VAQAITQYANAFESTIVGDVTNAALGVSVDVRNALNQAGGDITKASTQVANVGNAVAGDVGNLAQMGANAVTKVANSVVSSVSNTWEDTVKKIKKLFG